MQNKEKIGDSREFPCFFLKYQSGKTLGMAGEMFFVRQNWFAVTASQYNLD